jgi:hypothetical protein
MSLTSKSPQDVAREALAAGTAALTRYSHKFSPKTFTQPQLFACLVLRKFHKTDYRGIAAQLCDRSDLRQILELQRAPLYHPAEGRPAAALPPGVPRAAESHDPPGLQASPQRPPGLHGFLGLCLRPCQPLLSQAPRQGTKHAGKAFAAGVVSPLRHTRDGL